MQTLNCIIIDDEPLARKGLREYIADVDFLVLTGEFENPLKATNTLKEGNVQLVFLDIQMPKITGIEYLRSLNDPPPVVFTTAFPQYALEGFDLNALDYLVKPISFERFLKAAMKAREYYHWRGRLAENIALDTGKTVAEEHEYFFIKSGNKLVKIFFDDILYVEALQNYVTIHTKDKKYITYLTFKSVEEYLPAKNFIKCHKSYIIAASKISGIEGNDILIGNQQIPVSRNNKEEVMDKLLKGKFLKR